MDILIIGFDGLGASDFLCFEHRTVGIRTVKSGANFLRQEDVTCAADLPQTAECWLSMVTGLPVEVHGVLGAAGNLSVRRTEDLFGRCMWDFCCSEVFCFPTVTAPWIGDGYMTDGLYTDWPLRTFPPDLALQAPSWDDLVKPCHVERDRDWWSVNLRREKTKREYLAAVRPLEEAKAWAFVAAHGITQGRLGFWYTPWVDHFAHTYGMDADDLGPVCALVNDLTLMLHHETNAKCVIVVSDHDVRLGSGQHGVRSLWGAIGCRLPQGDDVWQGDLAPTVAYGLGKRLDVVGKTRPEVFAEHDAEATERRLRDLGYV